MNEDVKNFIKMIEQRESQYDLEIAEIRQTYKDEIPSEDVVTPYNIYLLRREKKRLDKKWGEDGKLSVESAFNNKEDASASLHYKSGKLSCSVYPVFKDGIGRKTVHRQQKDLIPNGIIISAYINHPYHEGDEIWAKLSKDRTNWEILYRNNQTGKSIVKARTRNFCNLRSLEKTLLKLENEWDVLSKGHKAIW